MRPCSLPTSLVVVVVVVALGCGASHTPAEPGAPATETRPEVAPPEVTPPVPPPVAVAAPKHEPNLEQGRGLFQTKGCNACHSIDGTPQLSVTMVGFWGSTIDLGGGQTLVADADYIRRVILEPTTANHRDGWRAAMPAYRSQLSDDELDDLIGYIASLR